MDAASTVCPRFVQGLSKVCPCPMYVQALPTHFGKIQYLSNLRPGQIHSLSRVCLYQATLSKQFYTGHTLDTRFSKVCPDIVHSKPLLASPTSNVRTSSKFCPHPMFVQTKKVRTKMHLTFVQTLSKQFFTDTK